MPTVIFRGASIPRRDDESVLDALVRAGADLPHSCKRGTCHACLVRAVDGAVSALATEGLSEELVQSGHFLPCQERDADSIEVELPTTTENFIPARLLQREHLYGDVWRLRFLPKVPIQWSPGQFIRLRRNEDEVRPYAIANNSERTRFVEIHVEKVPGGVMSQWLCETLQIGEFVDLQGSLGEFTWSPDDGQKDLFAFVTYSATGSLLSILRDAFTRGHRGRAHLVVSAPTHAHDALQALLSTYQAAQPLFSWELFDEQSAPQNTLATNPNLRTDGLQWLAGSPDVIQRARAEVILAGVPRVNIRTLYFEHAHDFWPPAEHPAEVFPYDESMWARLEDGAVIKRVLDDFYIEVYQDPILSPYFYKVTKEWAASKQYAFLVDAFGNKREYFGANPFNAHHWMIIQDWVFDYREDLFTKYLHKHGVDEDIQRRWLWYHEIFRREIVKSKVRGLIIGGEERRVQGFTDERIDVATLCDGCQGEINEGEYARLHHLSGHLFCLGCRYTLPEEEGSLAGNP